ncbi:hypothetical protein [Desulfogranum japonicum]|uniref:hypothetical protein n=1 Tax=Desulfogranum japonicum TaxID=231447 RepID=UPI0003FB8396|nr:hypothetical protein [Desulfogranum japonicum]
MTLLQRLLRGWSLDVWMATLMILLTCSGVSADDEFSFDVEEFEKKALQAGGYVEAKWEHINRNEQGAISWLGLDDDPGNTLDRLGALLQLNGSYTREKLSLYWLLQGSETWQDDEWLDTVDAFEAYVTFKSSANGSGSLGKKSYKWGKGYAWNPVGFINRSKDPNNPDEALEGYITAETEFIKSFSGNLQNLALTTVLLPVTEDVNDDFGQANNMNLAARLYLLYLDTDLDFILYTGNARSTRFGFDVSRNITPSFEVHGEYAFFPNFEKVYLGEEGNSYREKDSEHSLLLGIRHLTEFNLTSILEYYHNGTGYSDDELEEFYSLVSQGAIQYAQSGQDTLLQKAQKLGQQGYTKPYLGRDYLYARFSLKEPWDILYFTPALTTIYNLNDQSYSITPEILYTGLTNWEIRLRFSLLQGRSSTEYGEKLNQNKVELRVRYFF